MIREASGAVTAHQWSVGAQQWMSIGTVVDSAGSSGRKKSHAGQDYDYVFDVDIEEGKPPLKLPFNLKDNPYDAAKKFVEQNELPVTYLEQVADFIVKNTQGATLGAQDAVSEAPAVAGADPWGTESRYRPGDAQSSAAAPAVQAKILPQKTYLSIKQANLDLITKKISQLNEQLIESGDKSASLSPSDMRSLQNLISELQTASSSSSALTSSTPNLDAGFPLILRIITDWPPAYRLPGIDLLRLLVAYTPLPASSTSSASSSEDLIAILTRSGIFADAERPNNVMLGIRTFANLFSTTEGLALAATHFEEVNPTCSPPF
jgi:phospholipase A-2-activating protein